MKRVLALALILCLMCGCSLVPPEVTPDVAPTSAVPETAAPEGLELWLSRTLRRYNMEYYDFAEYWSLMCDGYFGDSTAMLVSAVNFEDKNDEIRAKRLELEKKYGEDWHYAVSDVEQNALDEKACRDFAAELNSIADRADTLVTASQGWNDAEWADFEAYHNCTPDRARAILAAAKAVRDACRDANVTFAAELTLTLEFSGSGTDTLYRTEKETVYEVNGVYVSEKLTDSALALVNML